MQMHVTEASRIKWRKYCSLVAAESGQPSGGAKEARGPAATPAAVNSSQGLKKAKAAKRCCVSSPADPLMSQDEGEVHDTAGCIFVDSAGEVLCRFGTAAKNKALIPQSSTLTEAFSGTGQDLRQQAGGF